MNCRVCGDEITEENKFYNKTKAGKKHVSKLCRICRNKQMREYQLSSGRTTKEWNEYYEKQAKKQLYKWSRHDLMMADTARRTNNPSLYFKYLEMICKK